MANTTNTVFDLTNYMSPLVADQFPIEYIQDGPNFIAFIQAYYQWMESPNNPIWATRNLLKLRDIDSTLPTLLKYFKDKYLKTIQFNTFTDQRLFIKNALPFWRSKGAPDAIKLFFQLVYGVNASLYYPKTTTFQLSGATWTIPTYLEITDPADNSLFINQPIIGANSGATAFVERYIRKQLGTKIIEVFYLSNISGIFQAGEMLKIANIVTNNTPTFTTGSLTELEVVIGGEEFNVGDIVNLINPDGFSQGQARVADTDSISGIVNFNLINGGYGYTSNAIILTSEYILSLTNVNVTNTGINTPYSYFETVTEYTSGGSPIAQANVMGISSNVTLYITNSSSTWKNGLSVTQGNTIGYLTSISMLGANTLLFLTNVNGIFVTSSEIYGTNGDIKIANGYLNSFDTSIGVYNANTTFTLATGNYLVGGSSTTNALVNSIYTGIGATFSEGNLINQEEIYLSIFQDYISGNNINSVPYIEINTDGSNGGIGSNGYGFPQQPLANLNTVIVPYELTIGTISSLNAINPGIQYNRPPFILIYEPLIAPMGLKDYIIPIAPSRQFLIGETVMQTTFPSNSAIVTTNNALSTINFFQLNSGGTGFTNGDLVKASTGTTNATANISTNSTGGITLLIITNYGAGFVPGSTPNISFSNSTGGTTAGTGANVTANVNNYLVGETVYEANSTANIAVGTIQYISNNILGVNAISGTGFATSNNIIGLLSNTTANIISVTTNNYSVTNYGIIKPGSNTTLIKVQRITYEKDFFPGSNLVGKTSGVSAYPLSINPDFSSNSLGWNAIVTANVVTANGSVTNLIVIDSGFGYSGNDLINFISQDGSREGTALAIVTQQGIGAGYYSSVNGFLSNNAVLQDGNYYQTFSYEVRTSISANTYLSSFANSLHVPGYALFTALYLDSIAQTTLTSYVPQYDQEYIMNITGSSISGVLAFDTLEDFDTTFDFDTIGTYVSNIGNTFNIGDTVTQGNSTGNVQAITSQLVFSGNTTYFQTGSFIYQPATYAIGYLNASNNLTSNTTLYISNVIGTFTTSSNIYGVTAEEANYALLQRIGLLSVINAVPSTGSFQLGESVFQINSIGNSAVGIINAGNASLIEINVISGTFANNIVLYGANSGAYSSVNSVSSLNISVGNSFYQESILTQLQKIQYFSNTGSFQIGETVYQNIKNINNMNAIEMNTMVGFVTNVVGNNITISGQFGRLTNNAPIYGTLTTVNILSVINAGFLQVGEPVYQNVGSANGIIQSISTQLGQGTIVIGSINGEWSNSYEIIGVISGESAIINNISNGVCSAMINGSRIINTCSGVISLINSSVVEVTELIGTIKTNCRSRVDGNTYLKIGNSINPVVSTLAITSAINTIDFQQIDGLFVITTNTGTILTDANTGATANITSIKVITL